MIFLATNMIYFLANLFLDPRSNYIGRRPPVPENQIIAALDPMNLNPQVPLMERWWTWLSNILFHWDWGRGFYGTGIVNEEISHRIWVSAQLVLGATILAVVVGVGLGVYTASRQYKFSDRLFQGISIVAMNTHTVVASLVLVIGAIWINKKAGFTVFYVTGGTGSDSVQGFFPTIVDILQRLTLPTLSLLFISYASYHMTQRSLLLDNIEMDYVRTARAKGLKEGKVTRHHALRNAMLPVTTVIGLQLGSLLGGAMLTETVFAWPGIGKYTVDCILKSDFPVVQGVVLLIGVIFVIINLVVDIIYAYLDPRIKYSKEEG